MELAELKRYVAGRNPNVQRIFEIAYQEVLETADTLDDDFQIAAAVCDVFERYAAPYPAPAGGAGVRG